MQNRTPLLGLLALTGAGVFFLARGMRGPEISPGLKSDVSRQPRTELPPMLPPGHSTESRPPGLARESESEDVDTLLVRCLSAADHSPVVGVRLYRAQAVVAGPSDAQGMLTVEGFDRGKHTLWAPGWAPTSFHSSALPQECLLEVADAALELRLLNFTGEHRVLRTLLQPRESSVPPEGVWAPVLEQAELDTLAAERLAPGSYDLYVWVADERDEPRAFSRQEIELRGGELKRVEIDIAGEPEVSRSAELSDDQ